MSELAIDVWLPQTPDEVFACFEDVYGLRRWYGPPPGCLRSGEDLVLVPGEPFRIELIDGEGGSFAQEAQVLAWEPNRGLTIEMRWTGGGLPAEPSRAVIQMSASKGGTRLEIRQGPLSDRKAVEAMRACWQDNLAKLQRVAAGEAVPCFEEFRDEAKGFVDPLGLAAYAVLAGLRESGAGSEAVDAVEETLYSHLPRLSEELAEILGTVLRERIRNQLA